MIENRKTEIEEEDEIDDLESSKRFVKKAAIVIGSIVFLMIVCLVMIFILENC